MWRLLVALAMAPAALLLVLPSISDLWAVLRSFRRQDDSAPSEDPGTVVPSLLFLIPAHNEEVLVHRAVESLLAQEYPKDRMMVVVVADNCSDDTAQVAASAGAVVLGRAQPEQPGKHQAIGWALAHLAHSSYDALVIVDADTIVDASFAQALAAEGRLDQALLQARVGVSNEDETWLTRLAGVLTRVRWDIMMPLKAGAGLSTPITGDGSVLGREIIRRFPWHIETVTEGWELYARFTLAGLHTRYVPGARLWAQEARSLAQGATQRDRWTGGRLAVLRRFLLPILRARGIGFLQRLDLLAELSSLGPVTGAVIGVAGAASSWLIAGPPFGTVIAAFFVTALVRPALYCLIALLRDPDPGAALCAFARLPFYAVWRVRLAMRTLLTPSAGTGQWVRTRRHKDARIDATRG